jgi:hypothetical protein
LNNPPLEPLLINGDLNKENEEDLDVELPDN